VLGDGDGVETDRFVYLVRPGPGWRQDDIALMYHRCGPTEFRSFGLALDVIGEMLATLVRDADVIVAHNAGFHGKMLKAIFTDAGMPNNAAAIEAMPTFCTMAQSTDICQVKLTSAGHWKSPKLEEAYRFFGGTGQVNATDWLTFARQQVSAVRAVYRALQERDA
jgi:hypothetical protein